MGIKFKNEKEFRDFCKRLSDDPGFKEDIEKATIEELVDMLLDNGFTYE